MPKTQRSMSAEPEESGSSGQNHTPSATASASQVMAIIRLIPMVGSWPIFAYRQVPKVQPTQKAQIVDLGDGISDRTLRMKISDLWVNYLVNY